MRILACKHGHPVHFRSLCLCKIHKNKNDKGGVKLVKKLETNANNYEELETRFLTHTEIGAQEAVYIILQ